MAKLNPQVRASAIQIVGVLAASCSERGVLLSDKAMRNCCLTAIRTASLLEAIAKTVEDNETLLTLPLQEAYLELGKLVEAQKKADAAPAPEQTPASDAKTEAKTEAKS